MVDQSTIHSILTDIQEILQQRLREIGAPGTAFVLMAIGPDGDGIVRSNVAPDELKALAADLDTAADAAMRQRPSWEQLN